MEIVMLIYAILLPTATGFLLVGYLSRCDDREGFPERLSLGFGLGMGMLTFEMFVLALFKIKFSLLVLSSMQVLTAALFAWLLFRSGSTIRDVFNIWPYDGGKASFPRASKLQSIVVLLIAAWVLLKLLFVIYEGTIWPVFAWDSLENWSSAAKFFFYEKGLLLDHGNEHFFGQGYRTFLNYPLHIPLMQVWISVCLGDIHEVYMKYWSVFYFIGVVALVYFAVRRESSRVIAVLAALFLSSVPLLTYHAIDAYADLPLGYYSLATAVCFRVYTDKKRERGDNNFGFLVLSGAFAALCLWTKMEGMFFVLASGITLLLYLLMKKVAARSVLARLFCFFAPIIIIGISWYAFLFLNGIVGRSPAVVKSVSELHFEVIPVILQQTILSANFNIIFIFLGIVVLLGIRTIFRSNLKYLLLQLVIVIAMYLFLYLATDNYVFVTNLTALNRNLLTFIPMMYYISALIAAYLLKESTED